MVCLHQIVIWGLFFFFWHCKATQLPESRAKEVFAGEMGLRKQHRNRIESNGFAPLFTRPYQQETATRAGLGAAWPHPSLPWEGPPWLGGLLHLCHQPALPPVTRSHSKVSSWLRVPKCSCCWGQDCSSTCLYHPQAQCGPNKHPQVLLRED